MHCLHHCIKVSKLTRVSTNMALQFPLVKADSLGGEDVRVNRLTDLTDGL